MSYHRGMPRKIVVCYLRADSSVLQDHVLNRLAAYMAPTYAGADGKPIVHVELFFPNEHDESNGMSAGICYGGQVFMHPKRFSRTHWEFHSVPVTTEQFADARAFVESQRGGGFNMRGFFAPSACNVSHSSRMSAATTPRQKWYCSELAAYTLLHAGVIDGADAHEGSAHPNATYHVIDRCCDTFVDCPRNLKTTRLSL